MPVTATDLPADHDPEKPNHMIFWLDKFIGDPTKYTHLKKAFGSNTDPRCETWTMLNDKDYDRMLASGDAVSIVFEGVVFLLQAFDDEQDCLNAFEKNQDKRIFFITSGTMGRSAVPKIIEGHRNVFTDRITNESYSSVYVFCHSIENQMDWCMDYLDYVQMFTHEADLLQRMTHDIADYFFERGRRIRRDNEPQEALKHLHWAKRLYHQYEKLDMKKGTDDHIQTKESKESRDVNAFIKSIESELPKDSSDERGKDSDNDESCGEACS
ncbi:unnamed protein product [Adineta steineri]|uniref:Uncharacterized protein n=1 Tax=Adineta steineri TaxID=433720 RepID=A0A819ZLK0_9BILA|nr:unnamed protein product [Adineta steineri]CAF4164543.1 unnamed protein product [Adineta steineri]